MFIRKLMQSSHLLSKSVVIKIEGDEVSGKEVAECEPVTSRRKKSPANEGGAG